MLVNISYNEPKIKRAIEEEVGKPFGLRERWAMGGIGSGKLFITETSIDVHNLLVLDQNINQCNVELRPLPSDLSIQRVFLLLLQWRV